MEPEQMLLDFGVLAACRKDPLREETIATRLSKSSTGDIRLMESICERENMLGALRRVERNGGAPGVDKMKVTRLRGFLRRTGAKVKAALLDGTYKPLPVRRKEIPKPDGGGVRLLGIPTCLDRFVQQCIVQVLLAIWDHTFSESSYGYRQGQKHQYGDRETQQLSARMATLLRDGHEQEAHRRTQ